MSIYSQNNCNTFLKRNIKLNSTDDVSLNYHPNFMTNHQTMTQVGFLSPNNEICSLLKENSFWTKELDNLISELAIKYKHDWKKVSTRIRTLTRKVISPKILQLRLKTFKKTSSEKKFQKSSFKKREDKLLIRLTKELGLKWEELSLKFTNRDALSLKNRYYYLMKKKSTNPLPKSRKETKIRTNILRESSLEERLTDTSDDFENLRTNKCQDIDLKMLVKDIRLDHVPLWESKLNEMMKNIDS